MKYAIAAGNAFVHKGRVIGPGEKATPAIFGEDAFMRHIAAGRIVPVPELPATAAARRMRTICPPLTRSAETAASRKREPVSRRSPHTPPQGIRPGRRICPARALLPPARCSAKGAASGATKTANAFIDIQLKAAAQDVVDAELALETAEAELKAASGEAAKKDAWDKIGALEKKAAAAKAAYKKLGAK